jgi:fused signal recognition particle receptor
MMKVAELSSYVLDFHFNQLKRYAMFRFIQKGYDKVKGALKKTRSLLGSRINDLLKGKLSEDRLDELEQVLYEADLGVQTAAALVEMVRALDEADPSIPRDKLFETIQTELTRMCSNQSTDMAEAPAGQPTVILIVGVNGNGKTTSVAKLAKYYQDAGKKVLIAAADTFRAAAIEQLEIWAQRLNIDIVKSKPKSDPSAVAFDAIVAGQSRKCDVVIIDTAGRLHTKTDLMLELQKIKRVCSKVIPGAPHETLLVLDATTGQNAIDQARTFLKFTPLSGLILTKLDGTAKGGMVIAIHNELAIPVKFIGVGEGIDDFEVFDPESFVSALLS